LLLYCRTGIICLWLERSDSCGNLEKSNGKPHLYRFDDVVEVPEELTQNGQKVVKICQKSLASFLLSPTLYSLTFNPISKLARKGFFAKSREPIELQTKQNMF
jgi:hypothetical protein